MVEPTSVAEKTALPNPSLKRSTNGGPPGPGRWHTVFVFLSHSGQEKPAMRELAGFLSKSGIPHFFDETSIQWGKEISNEVRQAIARTTHFVVAVSPRSIASGWVSYEVGIADGLRIVNPEGLRVLPWLAYPVDNPPTYLADRLYLNDLEEVKSRLLSEFGASKPISQLEKIAQEFGYSYGGTTATAVRLIGAAGEAFSDIDMQTAVDKSDFERPEELLSTWAHVLAAIKRRCNERGVPYHNSLHTRLVDYRVKVQPNSEHKQLELTLGPLWWEDYAVPNWGTEGMTYDEILRFVDPLHVARTGKVNDSRLHNILDTATTLVTIDGYVLYTKRGQRVAVGEGKLTSCIAENINAELDRSLEPTPPGEAPSPFRAALRGMGEEVSPLILNEFRKGNSRLLCLGLSYDLQSFHPDALFLGALSITFEQVLAKCKEAPGKDFFEGRIDGFHLEGPYVGNDFARGNWTGGGKASLLRALEFIQHWSVAMNCTRAEFCRRLAESPTPWRAV
jgi:TIR domain